MIHQGVFPGTFAGLEQARFCLVSLDADLYQPTLDALELFWPPALRRGRRAPARFQQRPVRRRGQRRPAFCAERGIVPVPLATCTAPPCS